MVAKVDTATISLWGHPVGAISWLEDRQYGVFEYEPAFLGHHLDIAPIHMGLAAARAGNRIFSFPALRDPTFLGLPGLVADALPDKFGNAIINAWLAHRGRDANSFSPVERLCYLGTRSMGALEFSPSVNHKLEQAVAVEVAELVALAQEIMNERAAFSSEIAKNDPKKAEAIQDILRVGTSAGGARPKAVIALNDQGKVLSGQAEVPRDFSHWLLKFDGVSDLELGAPQEYGRVEYAYYLMAQAAGITMTECRLLEENGRAHFMTRRFDRSAEGKLHLQSLCGLAHYDYNQAGAYSYEQAFMVMRHLRLSKSEAMEQYRRMVFNVLARNQDDHTKNIAFLMDRQGQWRLSPAFDVTYAHNPKGTWTNQHQMSLNGKRDNFTREDLLTIGKSISLPRPEEILEQAQGAVARWPEFADRAGLSQRRTDEITGHLRHL